MKACFSSALPRLRAGRLLSLVLSLSVAGLATSPALGQATRDTSPSASSPAAAKRSLAECIEQALANQPRIAASRASLQVAENGYAALDALRVPDCLVPELPIRRSQAAISLTAARALLAQAERDAVYGVTRSYYTVVLARAQERVTRKVVVQLTAVRDVANLMVEGGSREITKADVDRTQTYIGLAQTRQTEAEVGVQRGLALLREAMGLAQDCPLDVAAEQLPDPARKPVRQEILAAALARRGELIAADVFARLVCLEADAQATSWRKRMETFAAGADIHSQQVPMELRNNEYRPGAVAPEMPTLLVGPRKLRVEQARSLLVRAQTMVDVTRNLIALEAEDAFLRWDQSARQAVQGRQAADTGDRLAESLRTSLIGRQRVRPDDVATAQVVAAQARGQYNEFLFRKVIALADMERITAGQFCAGLVESAPAALPGKDAAANR